MSEGDRRVEYNIVCVCVIVLLFVCVCVIIRLLLWVLSCVYYRECYCACVTEI